MTETEEKKEQQIPEQNKLKVHIQMENGFLSIYYSKPITHLIMTKKDAREFARRIFQECL